ncbi:DUF1657 domain-containing protein [Aquibacillus sp. 3ASR75-11]|uniref:DUF1657 domain-containing protein n=1 Tax=Terrihalobacillus insolitus TaxID=2950438 RepID=A0A9X3WS20_9BACI|nr:DUF1657 domain-containing protein [Terrihalobacillus insolitus]MDC3412730.1 DUF1657 domain-containing protein [Terrihalobacillus insolitus]MDC3423793.1 DUF1657 domain-containing protein [Terrihalobacillus insolitus]
MTIGTQVKQCLSSIKSIEAGLSSLAIRTQDKETKAILEESAGTIGEIKHDMKARIKDLEREEDQYKGF